MSAEISAAIGRVRRAMPRNADVMLICDELDNRLRQVPLPLPVAAPPEPPAVPANPERKNRRQTTGSAATDMHRPAKGSSRRRAARTAQDAGPSSDGAGVAIPKTGFDKKAYQRDLMRKRRAAKKGAAK